MTNEKLLDLLREARECVEWRKETILPCDHDSDDCSCDFEATLSVLLNNIDSALAERQDSTKSVVESVEMKREWHEVNSPNRHEALLADGTRVTAQKSYIRGSLGWMWYAEKTHTGFVFTLAEAKSAAIAAARGVK
jgi:hypothetical protein